MFKTILEIVCRLFVSKKTEIEYVEAALIRYQRRLDELNDMFDPADDCCPSCAFYPEYSKLSDKIDRVEKWLVVLKRRKENGLARKRNKQTSTSKRNSK